MPVLSQKEIRDRAIKFAHEWKDETREKAEAQSFWNDFFNVFGITRRRIAAFEEPVKLLGEKKGSIDLFWKGTLIVEHKSRGASLDKAYQQALDYFPGIKEEELPKYVLVTDFEDFRLYNLEEMSHHQFPIKEFQSNIHLFGFISGYQKLSYLDEDPVNIQVAQEMGLLHDSLAESGYTDHSLEIFLVRLVYCLFADDTGIFPKDHFHYLLESRSNEDGSDTGSLLCLLFQILNTPQTNRQSTLDDELRQLPYVDGSLFEENLPIPLFNSDMRRLLLNCCTFDWAKVSPAIFGSMFQTVMDPIQRRNLGAHYTSEKNILKVVNALFLDDLKTRYKTSKDDPRKLKQLHKQLSSLRFLDPACGCGNFLIVSYRELRRLEINILRQLRRLSGATAHQLLTDVTLISEIDVDSMFGIEIEEFPARIAEVALWLTDHQMNMEMSHEFGQSYIRLPLKKSATIIHGNALRLDWGDLFPPNVLMSDATFLYILGNPPFVGKQNRTSEQNEDMEIVCNKVKSYGKLDYVSCWYIKAAELINDTHIRVAFVSTNSITQGEQVSVLWGWLLDAGIKLHFCHRTFRWSNEAPGQAAVYCVIVGFGARKVPRRYIYDYEDPDAEPMRIRAKNISPYLIDAENTLVYSRSKALFDSPAIYFGSMPNDGGHLLLSRDEKIDLLGKEPKARKYLRKVYGAQEFINQEERWCLWLVDADPSELRGMPFVREKIEKVRQHRLASRRETTRHLAEVPYLFAEIRQPSTNYLLIPGVSSENRSYIPIGFMPPTVVATNLCAIIPDATLYHFGVLTSSMHMAWVRQICGRLEGRYRYSNRIVYNNFPWPKSPSSKKKERVDNAAQLVLDARKDFKKASFADLYDPKTMPKKLRDAHNALNIAVDSCYGTHFTSELSRLIHLFKLHDEKKE